MVKGAMQQWLRAIIILLIYLRTEGGEIKITFVKDAVEKGAVCLDGTPPTYYHDEGSEDGVNNWLILLEGGGWCNDVANCLERMTGDYGSSANWEKNKVYFSGILSSLVMINPDFYNWHRIRVRYCDGASFTGDVETVDPETKLHFRGARIFAAVMEDLLEKGMKHAENAILAGCSASGLAAILHCDNFKALLPTDANVKCVSDAGYFINAKAIDGLNHIETFYNDIVSLHGSEKNLPRSCTSKLEPGQPAVLCFFPQNVVQQIQTPLFLVNAAYDTWQIKNILAPSGTADPHGTWSNCKLDILKCSSAQLETMQAFRLDFLEALKALDSSESSGYFINSCYVHCQTGSPKTWLDSSSPRLADKTIAKAVGDWFYDRSPFREIDCPYPCDKTCHNMVFKDVQPLYMDVKGFDGNYSMISSI